MVSVKQSVQKHTKLEKKQKHGKVSKNKQKTYEALPVKAATPPKLLSEEIIQNRNIKTKSKIKYVMPSNFITEELTEKCLEALEKLSVASKKKNSIFDEETQIFMIINCIKIQNSKGNIKFVLPHSTAASTGEICLITPDLKKGKKPDHEPTIDHWEEILKKADVTAVKTILPMRQLRVEYDQFELKRRLMTQHDFIMVDTRILNHVSHVLGKMFFKKHNMLIPVRLNENKDIKKNIDVGLRSVMLRLNDGHTSTVVLGHTGMSRKQLKENVISLVQQLREKFPGGEANIRSLGLKLPLSLSIPLYVTLRSSNTIQPPKLSLNKPKHFAVLEDELSTIPGSKVRVAPDGSVHLIKLKEKDSRCSEAESIDETEDNQQALSNGDSD